ncbi:MAG TPA: hypothetical protein VK957_01780 [Lunatimonas sp.]|nr:hypothetical protein [Lunatimonas sp.]
MLRTFRMLSTLREGHPKPLSDLYRNSGQAVTVSCHTACPGHFVGF